MSVKSLDVHHRTGELLCNPCGFSKDRPCSAADCPWKDRPEPIDYNKYNIFEISVG